jgi:hypothetical protein
MDLLNKVLHVVTPFRTMGGTRFEQGDKLTVVDYQEGEYLLERKTDGKRAYIYDHEVKAYCSEV